MKKIYKIFSIFAFSCSRKDGSNNSMIAEGNGINNSMIAEGNSIENNLNLYLAEKNFNKCRLNFCFGENKNYPNKKGQKYYENYGSETNFSICLIPYHKDLNQLSKISFGFTYPEYYDNFLKFKEIKIILEVSSEKKKYQK